MFQGLIIKRIPSSKLYFTFSMVSAFILNSHPYREKMKTVIDELLG